MKTSVLLSNLEVTSDELKLDGARQSAKVVNDAIKKINELELELYDLKADNEALHDCLNGGWYER